MARLTGSHRGQAHWTTLTTWRDCLLYETFGDVNDSTRQTEIAPSAEGAVHTAIIVLRKITFVTADGCNMIQL